jgi:hypothetical protein
MLRWHVVSQVVTVVLVVLKEPTDSLLKGLPKKGDNSFLPYGGNCLKFTWSHKPKHHNLHLHYVNLKYQCIGQNGHSRFTKMLAISCEAE